jgi:hypothetical protein
MAIGQEDKNLCAIEELILIEYLVPRAPDEDGAPRLAQKGKEVGEMDGFKANIGGNDTHQMCPFPTPLPQIWPKNGGLMVDWHTFVPFPLQMA